jgi:hypothetical protein
VLAKLNSWKNEAVSLGFFLRVHLKVARKLILGRGGSK